MGKAGFDASGSKPPMKSTARSPANTPKEASTPSGATLCPDRIDQTSTRFINKIKLQEILDTYVTHHWFFSFFNCFAKPHRSKTIEALYQFLDKRNKEESLLSNLISDKEILDCINPSKNKDNTDSQANRRYRLFTTTHMKADTSGTDNCINQLKAAFQSP